MMLKTRNRQNGKWEFRRSALKTFFGRILKIRKEELKILEGNQQILSQKNVLAFISLTKAWKIMMKDLKKKDEQTTFFCILLSEHCSTLPELVPADSRRADQDQGTLLVWLQSESQRAVKRCWMERGFSHWMCCHLVWYDIYALVQIKRWKCSKQIIKPVKKECWAKHSVICELEIYANRRDLTCCLS